MIINRDGLIRLLLTTGISFCIYLLTNSFYLLEPIMFLDISKSILLGASIWFLSEISFELVDRIWAHNIIPSYIVLVLIIGIGTTSGLLLFGINSIILISIISLAAEICGLTIAITSRRRYIKKLNSKLSKFKSEN